MCTGECDLGESVLGVGELEPDFATCVSLPSTAGSSSVVLFSWTISGEGKDVMVE